MGQGRWRCEWGGGLMGGTGRGLARLLNLLEGQCHEIGGP